MNTYARLAYGSNFKRILNEELIKIKKQNSLGLCIAFILITITVTSALLNWEVSECFNQFTDWTMWLTFLQALIMLKCYNDNDVSKKPGWLALAHTTFECCIVCNSIVVMIYWSLLH